MLAIRMRRVGSKKRPFFRLVVARSEAARDGSFLEILGSYYPRTKPARIEVDRERVNYWVSKGAKPSDTVRTLIARHLPPAPPAGETAETALPTPPATAPVNVAPAARPEPTPADVAPAAPPEPTPVDVAPVAPPEPAPTE